jgi:nicotinate-nucleotide adenylyltransferase
MKKKIVLFGGSFDPIHNGHTIVAHHAIEHIGAQGFIFIPAQRSPHKKISPQAIAADRLRMIELAIADNKSMCVSDCELKRQPPSFTIDTLRYFRDQYGQDAEFYWLVGADMLKDLPRWHLIEELLDECNLCLMLRPGFERFERKLGALVEDFGLQRVKKLEQNAIANPLVDISSTEIRQKLAAGEDVSQMMHPAVLSYIKEHGLYSRSF